MQKRIAKIASHFSIPLGRFGLPRCILVDTANATNTTRACPYCNALNPGTEKEQFICKRCGRQVKQDQNAAVNLSRIGSDPVLTEMALHASDV